MAPRKTSVNPKWLQTYSWLSATEDNSKVFCKLCKKPISISTKGENAIREHADGIKHKEAEGSTAKTQPIHHFFTRMFYFI